MKEWFLYVVCCNDDTLYTGVTTDLERRLHEHNNNSRGAKYTKNRRPVKLVYWEEHANRSQAQIAEYNFKRLSRQQKLKIVVEKNNA